MSRFRLSDPENLLLIMIVIGTILMVFHGRTIVKVPRCKIYEVADLETGEEWLLEDLEEIENLEIPDWSLDYEAPCLPNEDPDYWDDNFADYGAYGSYDYFSYNFAGNDAGYEYDDEFYASYDGDYSFTYDYDVLTEEAESKLVSALREKLHEE